MGSILYFLPGETSESVTSSREGQDDRFRCHGLTDIVLSDCDLIGKHVVISDSEKGPSGTPGVVVYPKRRSGEDEPSTYYRPSWQTWAELDGMWLGTDLKDACTAADLMRFGPVHLGYFVSSDVDGWLIPKATFAGDGEVTLPQDVVFFGGSSNGRPSYSLHVKSRFDGLWNLARELTAHYEGQENSEASDFDVRVGTAIAALQVNYRIGPRELEFLRQLGRPVLDTVTVEAFCKSLCGRPFVEDVKKKDSEDNGQQQPASSNATNGHEDDCQDTVQTGAT